MKQYLLPIQTEGKYNPHDFIFTACNIPIKYIIDQLPGSAGVNPYPGIMLVTGPNKSGKTHFAHLFQETANAVWVRPNDDISKLYSKYIVADDIDMVWDEKDLLHLFNYCNENDKIALLTCQSISDFKLPDLASRLSAVQRLNISPPDDVMLRTLLSKQLLERSLQSSDEVIKFLINRIPRNFESIFKTVELIDKLSLEQKRNINVHFLSSILN